jgi:hypothetical protein
MRPVAYLLRPALPLKTLATKNTSLLLMHPRPCSGFSQAEILKNSWQSHTMYTQGKNVKNPQAHGV